MFRIFCALAIGAAVSFLLIGESTFAEEPRALEKLRNGLIHFDEAAPGVYRCGLVTEEAAPHLKALGVKTVINFDNQDERAEKEASVLERFGIDTIRIPWSGWGNPAKEVVDQFLALMNTPELRPVLIHCKRGSERTGLAIALWRVHALGWPAAEAYQEMKRYEYRNFLQGHLKKYLYQFAQERGDKSAKLTNPFEQMKTNLFYFFFQLRKLKN